MACIIPLKHIQFRPLSLLSAFFSFLFSPLLKLFSDILKYRLITNVRGFRRKNLRVAKIMPCCNLLFLYMYMDICVRYTHTCICIYVCIFVYICNMFYIIRISLFIHSMKSLKRVLGDFSLH